jgi:hypothetical protein
MKKLLTSVLIVVMLFSFGVVSMAAPWNISGDAAYGYIDIPSNPYLSSDKWDWYDCNVYLTGKVKEDTTVNVNLRALGNSMGMDTNTDDLFLNQYYATIDRAYGTFTYGHFDWITYNNNIFDDANSVAGKIKSPFALGFASRKLADYYTVKAVYWGPKENNDTNYGTTLKTKDNAFAVAMCYNNGVVDASAHYLNGLVNSTGDSKDDAYIVDVKVTPTHNEWEKSVYFHGGENQESKKTAVLGGIYEFAKKYNLMGEYDLLKDFSIDGDYHRWGVRAYYWFNNHQAYWEYQYKKDTADTEIHYVRLGFFFF